MTSLETAIEKLTVQLWEMLQPFVLLEGGTNPADDSLVLKNLRTIISDAARLARAMRCMTDVVYYFPPTFKDEEFDPARMEALNLDSMIEHSPYKRKVHKGSRLVTAELENPQEENSEAIVQIVAFPGLVAYRQGGGSLAQTQLADERKRDGSDKLPKDVQLSRRSARDSPWTLTGNEGFRTRILCKGVVHLMWGRQRLLTKEAGTSRYLDAVRDGDMAKYEVDRVGCVELFDLLLQRNKEARATLGGR